MRSEAGETEQIDSYPKGTNSELRHRVAIRFVIEGDLRFISHRDAMRLFERALSRAGLPVRFTEGFNPRPRLSLPLPRPVGVASEAELIVVDLDEPVPPDQVRDRLAEQMPAGICLHEAQVLPEGVKLHPHEVTCTVPVPPDRVNLLDQAVRSVLEASSWPIRRTRPGNRPDKTLDVKAYLAGASIGGTHLTWTMRITAGGTLRTGEWLRTVGLEPEEHLHHVRRIRVNWAPEPPA